MTSRNATTSSNASTTTTATKTIASTLLSSSPSWSWLAVFVSALSYFVVTRFATVGGISMGGAARVGPVLTDQFQLKTSSTSSSTASSSACESLSRILYLSSSCATLSHTKDEGSTSTTTTSTSLVLRLKHGILVAQRDGLEDIVATTWRHDEELGRGYLLLSQKSSSSPSSSSSSSAGRVWRWEVGGGPFAIGRTLHLDAAGCRSNLQLRCDDDDDANGNVGAGGLAMDFAGKERFSDGRLVIAEWGERRIVRMEDETGARTPLLLEVPNLCDDDSNNEPEKQEETAKSDGEEGNPESGQTPIATHRRVHQPTQLLFTPFGDLLILEKNLGCSIHDDEAESAIFVLRQAVHVPALESLGASRRAHSWTSVNHTAAAAAAAAAATHPVNVLLHHFVNTQEKQTIGGMALTPQWTSLYVSTRLNRNGNILLLQVPITANDDDDDDDEEQSKATRLKGMEQAHMVFNLTHHFPLVHQAGPIAVTSQGYVFWVAPPYGLVLLHLPPPASTTGKPRPKRSKPQVLGHMDVPTPSSSSSSSSLSAYSNNQQQQHQQLLITSLTIGEDGYLYMSTNPGGALLRMRIRDVPVKVPVNLVPTAKKV